MFKQIFGRRESRYHQAQVEVEKWAWQAGTLPVAKLDWFSPSELPGNPWRLTLKPGSQASLWAPQTGLWGSGTRL